MFSEKEMRSAAAELNDKLGIEPPIDTKAKIGPLTEAFTEALALIAPDDKFSDKTQAIIDEVLGGGEDGGEGENGEGDGEEPSLKDQVDAADARADLVELVKTNPVFKGVGAKLASYKTSKDLRGAMMAVLEAEEAAQQQQAEEIHEKNIASKPVRVGKDTPAGKTPVTKERFAAKKSTGAERVDFLTPLIQSGKYTKAELVEKANKEFPDVSASTFQTMLTDAKNPKYNKFAKLVVQAEDGTLSFKK
jgi:hypothetical protein